LLVYHTLTPLSSDIINFMKILQRALKLIMHIVLVGVALGLILAVAGVVAGYSMLGFFYWVG